MKKIILPVFVAFFYLAVTCFPLHAQERGRIGYNSNIDTGFLELRGPGGRVRSKIGSLDGRVINNFLTLNQNTTAKTQVMLGTSQRGGVLVLTDRNGSFSMALLGDTGQIIKRGTNGFLIPHPQDPSKEIFYVSLEGPEEGMYIRGSAHLRDGRATISLPEHFSVVAKAESLTVHLTPNSASTYGLAVIKKKPTEIEVRELAEGKGSFLFDYTVFATRNDVEPVKPIRKRTDFLAEIFKGGDGQEKESSLEKEQAGQDK